MDDKNKNAIDIYNTIAEEYSKNYDHIDGEEDLVFLNTFLSHLKKDSQIIDIGCGTGFSAGFFVSKGMRVEGVDLSSSMIAIAKRNYPKIKFLTADMRDFKSLNRANAVWAGYSLFHFDRTDFEKTIESLKCYLQPKGIFGLVIQEGEGELEAPEPFIPGRKIFIRLYTENELTSILKQHGFEIIEKKRKIAKHDNEFPYNKLLLIAKLV